VGCITESIVLFIDAQQYLDLYRMCGGKQLLGPLAAVKHQVFITAQIADEVTRNKLGVACKFFADDVFKGLMQEFKAIDRGLPNHLFSDPITSDLRSKLKAIRDGIGQLRKASEIAVSDLLQQIGRSEDEVSRVLAGVFEQAVEASPSELDRARARKERGRAPGKSGDALGDQISWEQLLSCAEKWSEVWIISRDCDYCHKYAEAVVLNASLYHDLMKKRPGIVAHCFTEMEKGLRDFLRANPVPDAKLPPPEEAERINREQGSLPPMGWLDGDDGSTSWIRAVGEARRNWPNWRRQNSQVDPWESVEGLPPPGLPPDLVE
jgi:hypothetical protein